MVLAVSVVEVVALEAVLVAARRLLQVTGKFGLATVGLAGRLALRVERALVTLGAQQFAQATVAALVAAVAALPQIMGGRIAVLVAAVVAYCQALAVHISQLVQRALLRLVLRQRAGLPMVTVEMAHTLAAAAAGARLAVEQAAIQAEREAQLFQAQPLRK